MRRTREESAGTRRALIAAATLEFAERGYQGASLRSICAAAHVTTGALYFLFAGKGEDHRAVGAAFRDSSPAQSEAIGKAVKRPYLRVRP